MKLSIIIPCYNEAKNIPLIFKIFSEVIHRNDIEIILVNNGSTDSSAEVFAELIPKHSFARLVTVNVNQGYGFGILSGLKEAKGEYLGWTHADMQTDPNDIIRGLECIEERGSPRKIFVKGSRKGRKLFDQFFTTSMSLFESLYLKVFLFDINAQPNLFHQDFFKAWNNPPHDFSLDLYALYMARKMKLEVVRILVLFPERIHGQSSWNISLAGKWKFIKRTLTFSFKLKKDLPL